MDVPAIVVNFKSYSNVDGDGALDLALTCQEVAHETGKNIVICPPNVELARIIKEVDIPVFAQNVDIWDNSVKTGSTTLTGIKAAGASGLLINHSECRRKLSDIQALILEAKKLGLTTIVCSNNVVTSKAVSVMGPDFVAMEPPELIGGDISVTSADPGIVLRTVEEVEKAAPDVRVLTGAGVKNKEDVRKALELGTYGVLLASGVVKAEDPMAVLLSMADGF